MSQELDPLTFPLCGSRLIEASAGTGKTYTLALLYIRLVLGHGGEGAAFSAPLTPPQILVVTFTDAATKELRERVRQRLVEAAVVFEADSGLPADADLLYDLRGSYPPGQWLECARRLRMAAQWMDESVISTIHGWCYRMLKEHAFDTRGLFEQTLVTDQSELIDEVVRDYWRVHFYPLSSSQAPCVLEVVSSPADLRDKLEVWLKRGEAGLSYAGEAVVCQSLDKALAEACQRRADAERHLTQMSLLEQAAKTRWREHRETLEKALRKLRPYLNGSVHDSSQPEKFDSLLASIADWSTDQASAPGKLKNFAQGAFRFKTTAAIKEEIKHPAFAALATWQAAATPTSESPSLPFAACLLAHAAGWVRDELQRRLLARAEMGFDDLLRQLDAALTPKSETEAGHAQRLAETIRRQFPVALIDEFQDTDPIQYRIFDRIYAVAQSGADRTLIMIGDPKQAIYGFRGADIHAYLAARKATAGRHYTLGKNYRATENVVNACNRLFRHAESHSRGAFRFNSGTENPIPFLDVDYEPRNERLILDGEEANALTFWTFAPGSAAVSAAVYRRQMAAAAASQMVCWLQQARQGKSGFKDAGQYRPLRPRDFAILVRTGKEAQVMRQALAQRGIHSVYLSDSNSVFQTQEAVDLLHWLRACAMPNDEGLVRAALGSNTLNLPLAELARLQQDELDWEDWINKFRCYFRVWRRQGVLAMLRHFMQETDLPRRLVARDDGERVLTNLLHLAEWLQASATAIKGEQALIRHLSEHIGEVNEEFIQRLESDAELVQIITIHKSKGLEYPLVLLPFICSWRAIDGKTRQVLYRKQRQNFIELAGNQNFREAWDAADDERLSEDMRLLYVALTRARHALWLGIAPLKFGNTKKLQLHKSAIGYLLKGGRRFADVSDIWAMLQTLQDDDQSPSQKTPKVVDIAPLPDVSATRLAAEQSAVLESARPAPKHRPPRWWIASYSSLKIAAAAPAQMETPTAVPIEASAETSAQETALEEAGRAVATEDEAQTVSAPDAHLHGFPHGSRYGTFLHGLMEWAASQRVDDSQGQPLRGYAAAAQSAELRREMLGQRCNLRRLTAWIEPLNDWLGDVLNRQWRLKGLSADQRSAPVFALRDLAPEQIQVEMEFWIESRGVDTYQLDRLVCQHCLAGQVRPGLAADQLNGMLKGFIDLVFEHDGRYYVADWKSNRLGADDAAYHPEAMRQAMLHARYDLQYVLYLLALHRQLRLRLPDYSYERHIGGAVYVFLRGAYHPSQGLFMDKPPAILIEALDRLFAGESITYCKENA